jgi:predicted nucleic-acid-binding Zn-ribbon protein
MEKPKQEVKCPKCGQGLMKMVLATSPLTEVPKVKPMQARCTKCGFEDDYTQDLSVQAKGGLGAFPLLSHRRMALRLRAGGGRASRKDGEADERMLNQNRLSGARLAMY